MLLDIVKSELSKVNESETDYNVSYSEYVEHGHISTNIALILAKQLKQNPKEMAENIKNRILENSNNIFKNIEVAGLGFINFTFNDDLLEDTLNINLTEVLNIIKEKNISNLNNKTVLVEYTDANPFKVFHIGHLMTNVIGESIAGIYELAGANVKRINYQGDVGRHIAINIYAILKSENKIIFDQLKNDNSKSTKEKVIWLGEKYAEGYADFESSSEGDDIHSRVTQINKMIYEKSDEIVNEVYTIGREWSLMYFETLYALLGTKFDKYIFESECAEIGAATVRENMKSGIFETGDEGAVIYNGERFGLHKRVFINKNGLPTYEAKDLGNMQNKISAYPNLYKSLVITGNEQTDYFKVLYSAISQIHPELTDKISHLGHGMMRFADGKMSSRRGNVIAGDELIYNLQELLQDKFSDSRINNITEKNILVEKVSIGAIKYAILRQAIGRDVIFDTDKVISIEGDSGPYIQYTHARFCSVANDNDSVIKINDQNKNLVLILDKYVYVLEEVVRDVAPHKLISYMIELARMSNAWYSGNRINGDSQNERLAYKIKETLAHGMNVIKIHAPNQM